MTSTLLGRGYVHVCVPTGFSQARGLALFPVPDIGSGTGSYRKKGEEKEERKEGVKEGLALRAASLGRPLRVPACSIGSQGTAQAESNCPFPTCSGEGFLRSH